MVGDRYYDKALLGSMSLLALTTIGAQVLPSNHRRMSVTFCGSAIGRYTVYFGGAVGAVDKAVNIPVGSIPITLTRGELGSMIEQSIFAIGQVANIFVALIEVSEP